MHSTAIAVAILGANMMAATPAFVQRFPFERTFQVDGPTRLDVETRRGKVAVSAGDTGHVEIKGVVTVRVGWDVPANAVELARQVALNPPVAQAGDTIRLRPPAQADEQRAVTVSYEVRVPREARVQVSSDSGAITVSGIGGSAHVKTQSGAIDLTSLGGAATVSSGSGAIVVDGAAAALSVDTSSSAFTGRGIASSLRVHTASGQVDATLTASGDVDIDTGSSAIILHGVRGALTAVTRSGRVTVDGSPAKPWTITTGSSAVEMTVNEKAPLSLDLTTDSGSIVVEGATVQGPTTKRRVQGTLNGGGPLLRVESRSGSLRLRAGS